MANSSDESKIDESKIMNQHEEVEKKPEIKKNNLDNSFFKKFSYDEFSINQ